MADERSRRERPPRFDRHLVLGGTLSAVLHAVAIVLLLVAPARFQPGPPTAYTVEVVDPDALGGDLLAGPIGGGEPRRAPKPAPPPPPPAKPEPPPEPPPPKAEEPEQVAKAEPPESEEGEVVPVATARPTAKPTPKQTARPQPTAKPTAIPPKATAQPKPSAPPQPSASPKPAATRVAVVARASSPIVKASPVRAASAPGAADVPAPAKTSTAPAAADAGDGAEDGEDLDSRLSAAIKGVESKVGHGSGVGPAGESGGGLGGTADRVEGPPGVGGSGPGGGGQVRGLEFVAYYGRMLNRIKERWTWLGERADLRVTVRFSILPSGDIANLRLMERSGDASYDASVERAVKAASPFSPPPEAYLRDFADVELTFRPADLRSPS